MPPLSPSQTADGLVCVGDPVFDPDVMDEERDGHLYNMQDNGRNKTMLFLLTMRGDVSAVGVMDFGSCWAQKGTFH